MADDAPAEPVVAENPVKFIPKPPRRAMSAYVFFVKDNFRDLQSEMKAKFPQPVIRAISNKWKFTTEAERNLYKAKEEKDKVRYRTEKAAWAKNFTGKLPRMRKKPLDELAPKRARNSYLFFVVDFWPTVRNENPDNTQRQLIQEIARRWRMLDEPERNEYRQLAKTDRERYVREMKDYRRRKMQEAIELRMKRKSERLKFETDSREAAENAAEREQAAANLRREVLRHPEPEARQYALQNVVGQEDHDDWQEPAEIPADQQPEASHAQQQPPDSMAIVVPTKFFPDIGGQKKLHIWDQQPKPPPRARTPYALFVSEYYEPYQRCLRTRNPQDIIRAIGNGWRQLDPKMRASYNKKSEDDKKRFDKEIVEWRSHFKDGSVPHCRRKRKNPLAPKRTRNPFIFYQREVFPDFRLKNKGTDHRELTKMIAESWRRLDRIEKQPFLQRCQDDKVRYRAELRQYRIDRAKRQAEIAQRRQVVRLEALKQRRLQEKLGIQLEARKVAIIIESKPK